MAFGPGSISADRADHRAKVLIDPDPALSEQQMLLIDQGIGEGALIRVHSDGRLEYFLPLDSRQSGEQAAQMRVAVKQEIDSGRLQEEMRNGHTLSVEPDGTIGYEWSSDPRLTLPTMTRMTEPQVEDLVAGIECPVRAIFADPAQSYLPDALRRRRVALLPQGELVVIAGGHHLHMQQAAEVAAAIGDFFTA